MLFMMINYCLGYLSTLPYVLSKNTTWYGQVAQVGVDGNLGSRNRRLRWLKHVVPYKIASLLVQNPGPDTDLQKDVWTPLRRQMAVDVSVFSILFVFFRFLIK